MLCPQSDLLRGEADGRHCGERCLPWAGTAGLTTPGVDYDSTVLATAALYEEGFTRVGMKLTSHSAAVRRNLPV